MDARIEAQILGIDHTIPRRARGQNPAEARPHAAAKPPVHSDAPQPPRDLFDANRDGVIEHWSYAHGGDSFETFTPPPSGKAGANARRSARAVADAATQHVRSTDRPAPHASTAAAIHKAHDAYRSDGLAHSSGVRASTTPAPVAPAVAPLTKAPASTPPVTSSAPATALPSPGS